MAPKRIQMLYNASPLLLVRSDTAYGQRLALAVQVQTHLLGDLNLIFCKREDGCFVFLSCSRHRLSSLLYTARGDRLVSTLQF